MWQFDPVFPPLLIGFLVSIIGLFTCFLEFRPGARRLRPTWLRWPALFCRLAALTLLGVLLMNPSRFREIAVPEAKPLILLDESDSMNLKSADGRRRWEEARSFLDQMNLEEGSAELRTFSSKTSEADQALEELEPSGGLTRLSSALKTVISNDERAYDPIILLTDGRLTDRAELDEALALALDKKLTLGALPVGDTTLPRNASIQTVIAPEMVRAKATVKIRIELQLVGFADDEILTLVVKDSEENLVATREVSPKNSRRISMTFPSQINGGTYVLELQSEGDEEISYDDNRYTFDVEVAVKKLRVLMVEGTHVKRAVGENGHFWNDLRLLTDAWTSSGDIEYELLTAVSAYTDRPNLYGVTLHNGEMKLDRTRTFPKTREELYQFDVMMISDIPVTNFSEEQMQWVVDWVTERGAGFLMAGGYSTFDVGQYDQTVWEKIIPVDMLGYGEGFSEKLFEFEIPSSVKNHPLWALDPDQKIKQEILDAHPRFRGMNRIRRAKPGALVLAERADAPGEPVIAAQQYGRGRSVAFMPDLNGGWGADYIQWGPNEGPRQGPQVELGHGGKFIFNEVAAKAPEGPEPPHPSPYYARYWVNMVKWLGANSVRWRDNNLAGKISAVQVLPGAPVSVSAEVLAVVDPERIPDLDVAARVNAPGASRVRLEYDRDRREYVGELPMPEDLDQDQVSVIFEADFDGQSALDEVVVSVGQMNPEYIEIEPDRQFLNEVTAMTGGRLLSSPEEAKQFLREVREARSARKLERVSIPIWPVWTIWAILAGLLGLEWLLRRHGHRASAALATVVVFSFCGLSSDLYGQDLSDERVEELMTQLGAKKVRLRDEAEKTLREYPEVASRLKELEAQTESLEVKLRTAKILKYLQSNRWQLDAEIQVPEVDLVAFFGLTVSADGTTAFARSSNEVIISDLKKAEFRSLIDQTTTRWGGWKDDAAARFIELAPKGEFLIITNGRGEISKYSVADGAVTTFAQDLPDFPVWDMAMWSMDIYDSGKRIMTATGQGKIEQWKLPEGKMEKVIETRTIALPFAMRVSPNGRYLVVAMDEPSKLDHLWCRDLEKEEWLSKVRVPILHQIRFFGQTQRFIGFARDGNLYQYEIQEDGSLEEYARIQATKAFPFDLVLAPDEKSAFISARDGAGQISEFDLSSGELLWQSPPLDGTVSRLAFLPDGRLLALQLSGEMTIWKKRGR